MSKLWIIHRQPRRRDALEVLCGLATPDVVCGGPTDSQFENASSPAVILVGVDGDFELELDFLHRYRHRLARSRRIFLAAPEAADDVRRLFDAAPEEILDRPPSDRQLRALVVSAVAHRNAESLAGRREREQIRQRFSRWFADGEVPGLLRALDPDLGALPLLVRGVPGSGRSLLARYAELFRATPSFPGTISGETPDSGPAQPFGPVLRLAGAELRDVSEISRRQRERAEAGLAPIRTVWIDEIDAAPSSVQRTLAEWIRLGIGPADPGPSPLRWVATAAAPAWPDPLEATLEQAFAPLSIAIAPLVDDTDALARFADGVCEDWSATVGGMPQRLDEGIFPVLEAHAWTGDRAAVESILRSTLAGTAATASAGASAGTAAGTAAALADGISPGAGLTPESSLGGSLGGARSESIARAPVEDTDFLDEVFEDTSTPQAPQPPLAPPGPEALAPFPEPSAAVDDFERAFLEGLPEPGPPSDSNSTSSSGSAIESLASSIASAPAPRRTSSAAAEAGVDPSAQFSDESFEMARSGALPGEGPSSVDGPEPKNQAWRRLARSLSHEIRNPLVSIRTFTELLPGHFEDASFRERFTELVGRDVAHIDEVVSRLADAAASEKLEASPVDVSALLEGLLDSRSERIGQGRLLVLRELERESPIALADPHALEVALAGLLDRALAALPERGDLFVATRRLDPASDRTPRLRVLLRHHNPELAHSGSGLEDVSSASNILEYVLAETVVEACGGSMTIDSTDAEETLILVDLLTPA